MLIKLNIDKVVLATHLFIIPKSVGTDIMPEVTLPESLSGHQIEPEGIVCYGGVEQDAVKTILINNSIPYTLEELNWPQEIIDKASEKTYETVEEAWNDLPVITMDSTYIVDKSFAIQMIYPPIFDSIGVQCAAHMQIDSTTWAESPLQPLGSNIAAKIYEFGAERVFKIEIAARGFETKYFELPFKVSIDNYKEEKINQLSQTCQQAIMNNFRSSCIGTEYGYDFDYEAQINLAGILLAINGNMVTEPVIWKTKEAGPLPHTIAQIQRLWADGLIHKQTLIAHFWDIRSKIEAPEVITKEQVDSLAVW